MYDREKIIRKAVGGDRLAQNELFQEYWDLIESIVRMKTNNDLELDDLINTTLMMAFEDLPHFTIPDEVPLVAAFEKWLKVIAGNRVIDAARYRKAAKRGGGWKRISNDARVLSTNADVLDFLSADSETASRILAREEAVGMLTDALEYLKQKCDKNDKAYYEVVRLKFLEGLTDEEVAEELDCSTGQVRNYVRTATKLLREELGSFTLFLSNRS